MREGVQYRFDKSAQGKLEKNKGKEREPESYFWGFVIAKKKDKQSENTADVEKKFTIQQKNESMFAGALYFSVYEFVHNGGEGSPAEGIRKSVDEIIDDDPHRVPQDRDGSGAEEGADHEHLGQGKAALVPPDRDAGAHVWFAMRVDSRTLRSKVGAIPQDTIGR